MLELFSENGHLTDQSLLALVQEEELDDLQRLEISEHLSFCDACTARYTDLLCDDILQSPSVPLYGEIMKKIREKERRLFLRRLTTVSAAACLAMVFWWSGVFTIPNRGIEQNPPPQHTVQTLENPESSGLGGIRAGLQQLTSGFGEWTKSFLEPFDKAFSKTYEKENSNGEK